MLINFAVSNFLSFREETELNMIPAKSRKMRDHILVETVNKKTEVLPVAVVYGNNASGKSNLIAALQYMQSFVLRGVAPRAETGVIPFALDSESRNKPSRFEVIFRQDDVVYSYGFVASSNIVHEEWLFGYFTSQESLVFERVSSDGGATTVKCGSRLLKEKGKKFLDVYGSGTRQEQLFLTEAFRQNTKTVEPVIDWFRSSLMVITPHTAFTSIDMKAKHDLKFRSFLEKFLCAADTGIKEVSCLEEDFDRSKHLRELPEQIVNDILEKLALQENGTLNINMPGEGAVLTKRDNSIKYMKMRFGHSGEGGRVFPIDKENESDGTRRLVEIAPALDAVRSKDIVLVIDELDRSLHTDITRFYVRTFLTQVMKGKHRSQLIFSTHDTNLLDRDLFRKDEIWFLEKDVEGVSHISSLAEYNVNKGLNYENGYLNGRFGSIPFLGNISWLLNEDDEEWD